DKVSTIFADRVGSPYSREELRTKIDIATERYKNQIPPGYSDTNKGGERQYGDALLWLQLLDYARETQKPVILVTDDRKEDRWRDFNGERVGPRPELIAEIWDVAGVPFYMYSSVEFLRHAESEFSLGANADALEETRA